MKKILCLFLVVLFGTLSAQQTHFRKSTTCVDPANLKTVVANDSGWFVFGNMSNDVRIARFTRTGQLLWTRALQQTSTVENVVDIMNRGSHLLCVYSTTAGGGGITVAKLDTSANITWTQTVNFGGIRSATVASNGDIYLVGNTGVLRMDSAGTVKWRKNYSMTFGEWFEILEVAPQRFILLGQQAYFTMGNTAVALNCIDSSGAVQWQRFIGYPQGYDYGYHARDFLLSSDGYLYITGNAWRHQLPSVNWDAFVMKVDTSGYQAAWTLNFGTNDPDSYPEIVEMPDSTFMVWGLLATSGPTDAYVMRLTSEAQIISTKRTGYPANSEEYFDLDPFDDGTCIVGWFRLNTTYVSRLSYTGSEGCADTLFFNWAFERLVSVTSLLVPNSVATNVATTIIPTTQTTVTVAATATNICFNTCSASATFTPSQFPYCVGDSIHMTNGSTGALSNYWYVNNQLQDSTVNFSYLPSTPGIYVIKLKTFGVACADSIRMSIRIDSLPDAQFTSGGVGLIRTFTPLNYDVGSNYFWTYGDGQFGADSSHRHTYFNAGVYDVQLIAANACGSDTSVMSLTIVDTVLRTFDWRFDEGGVGYPHYGAVAKQFPNGRIFVGGTFEMPYQDAYFGLANSSGQMYYSRTISLGNNNDRYNEILFRSGYRVLMIGRTGTAMVIQQMDTAATVNSVYRYTFPGGFTVDRAVETRDFGYAICGALPAGGFLAKFSTYNVLSKVTQYPGTASIKSIVSQQNGSLLLGGNSSSNSDVVLIHADSSLRELFRLGLDKGFICLEFWNRVASQWGLLLSYFVGSLILSTLFALAAYPLALRWIKFYRSHRK